MKKLIVIMLLVFPSLGLNMFSPKNILNFADFLYEQKDYLRASGEYLRYLYGGGKKRKYAWKMAIWSLYKANEAQKAWQLSQRALQEFPHDCEIGAMAVLMGALSGEGKPEPSQCGLIQQANAFFWVRQGRWLEAEKELKTSSPFSFFLKKEIEKRKKLGWKSPWKAAFLSAILPGSGKIYAGRWKEGVYSLFLVGVSGWQAWRKFRQGKKGWGYFYAGMSLFFYVGNIYGSAVAAKIYNRVWDMQINREIIIAFPMVFGIR